MNGRSGRCHTSMMTCWRGTTSSHLRTFNVGGASIEPGKKINQSTGLHDVLKSVAEAVASMLFFHGLKVLVFETLKKKEFKVDLFPDSVSLPTKGISSQGASIDPIGTSELPHSADH